MGTYEEADGLMAEHAKKDITMALLRSRERGARDRRAVVQGEERHFELIDALGLLPESVTHSDVLKRAHDLREIEQEHRRLTTGGEGHCSGDHEGDRSEDSPAPG